MGLDSSPSGYSLILLLPCIVAASVVPAPSPSAEGPKAAGKPPLPGFSASWLNDKNAFRAGDPATVMIRPFGSTPDETDFGRYSTNFSLTVDGKRGNSSRVSSVLVNTEGDPLQWNISFVPIWAGEFMAMVEEEYSGDVDSSLHFSVVPGNLYPAACVVSWENLVNEFLAGAKAGVLILPKDAFGNNISSTSGEATSPWLTLWAYREDGSAADLANITYTGWNGLGHLVIEFVPTTAGSLSLHAASGNQTLNGCPLLFKVKPGALDIGMCRGKWKYDKNVIQIFSRLEFFVYQSDQYGNLVQGFYEFDAGVLQKETNLSIPVADVSFQEMEQGVQLLSFEVTEPGNFVLRVFDAKQKRNISHTSYGYSVFVGYCDGINSIVNGSGLTGSVAGRMSYFSIYLEDIYHNPSPVEARILAVHISRENDSYTVSPVIFPQKEFDGERAVLKRDFPRDSRDTASGSHDDRDQDGSQRSTETSFFHVAYIPMRSGNYAIRVFCGNIPLNGGRAYPMHALPGKVDTSHSSIVNFAQRTKRLAMNEVAVRLLDSFGNPVTTQQRKLIFKVDDVNISSFLRWRFADKGDGLYIGNYLARDIGNYNICVLYEDVQLSPCPFVVNVHEREYFPEANDDNICVWEDESVFFDVTHNDYLVGNQVQLTGSTMPVHGSLIQHRMIFQYTPYKGFFGNDSFSYSIYDVNGNIDTGTVFISVLCKPPQFISLPTQLQVVEDVISPKFGGFSGFAIKHSDKLESISVTLKAEHGTIFLSPMPLPISLASGREIAVTRGGITGEDMIVAGNVEMINYLLQMIQYLGKENFYGEDVIILYAMNKNGQQEAHVPVYVEPVNNPPFIHVPEFIFLEETKEDFQIFGKQADSVQFLVGDPDLDYFTGNRSHFTVTLSMELNEGILICSFPDNFIGTVELKIKNSHQWQHLQTFVTISNYFVIKGKGIRIRANIDECNDALKKLLYHGSGHGAVLFISINDMGNYGRCPDCSERLSLPLYTEATVNLIKRSPTNSLSAKFLGAAIVIEFVAMLLLGAILLFFLCKCTNALYKERPTHIASIAAVDSHVVPGMGTPPCERLIDFVDHSSQLFSAGSLRQRSLGKSTSRKTHNLPSTPNHQRSPSSSFAPFSIQKQNK